jgi:hypothetical protein
MHQLEKASSHPHQTKSGVKPMYKNRTKEDADNYRPITLVPILSKVLEKVIANQLIAHLDKHSILNKFILDLGKINLQTMQLPQLLKT